jgi:hypothetical protein
MALDMFSETVGPNGNIQAAGIMNQLGRPNLDPLTILIREAVQNSWDARNPEKNSIEFGISGWTLNKEQLKYLRNTIFNKSPNEKFLPLGWVLNNEVDVLAIHDLGTIGLGGPTRADIYTEKGPRDFVDFVRNIGQPSDKQHAGGTYGYGKAAFYKISTAQTIIIYTRCFYHGKYQNRLIATALGNSYKWEGKIYTGRHWWGKQTDGIIEPILDKKADEIAQQIGLKLLQGNDCGTTIVIIAPNFSGEKRSEQMSLFDDEKLRTPYEALNFAAECILWYFWPKMIMIDNTEPAIKFFVRWQNKEIKLPRPEQFPPLKGFVDSMLLLKQKKSNSYLNQKVLDISTQKPNQKIGELALHVFQIEDCSFFNIHVDDKEKFHQLTHHTAVMRKPELVVRYIPGPSLANEWFGYGGVFIANENVDYIFANSEPPTHDNWIVDSLEDRKSKTVVRTALKEISQAMDVFSKPPAASNPTGLLIPLGSFANQLGESLFTSVIGTAATSSPPIKYIPTQVSKNQIHEQKNNIIPTQALQIENILSPIKTESNICPTNPTDINNFQNLLVERNTENKSNSSEVSSSSSNPTFIGKAKIKPINDGEYILVDGVSALNIHFIIQPGEHSKGTIVEVKPYAIVDGYQTELEPPIGGSYSEILYWVNPEGLILKNSQKLHIPLDKHGEWQVILSVPEDIMLGIDFSAVAEESL